MIGNYEAKDTQTNALKVNIAIFHSIVAEELQSTNTEQHERNS